MSYEQRHDGSRETRYSLQIQILSFQVWRILTYPLYLLQLLVVSVHQSFPVVVKLDVVSLNVLQGSLPQDGPVLHRYDLERDTNATENIDICMNISQMFVRAPTLPPSIDLIRLHEQQSSVVSRGTVGGRGSCGSYPVCVYQVLQFMGYHDDSPFVVLQELEDSFLHQMIAEVDVQRREGIVLSASGREAEMRRK